MLKKSTFCYFALFLGVLFTLSYVEALVNEHGYSGYFLENYDDNYDEKQADTPAYYPVNQIQNRIKTTVPRRWLQERYDFLGNAVFQIACPGIFSSKLLAFATDRIEKTAVGALLYLYRYVLF